jgi:DNA polymerase-4
MLKVKFSSFETVTRSVTSSTALTTGPSMVAALEPLLGTLDCTQGVRLLGVHAQKLIQGSSSAPTLFDVDSSSPAEIEEHWVPASKAVDSIIEKFGEGMIGPASGLGAIHTGQRRFGPLAED